NVDASATTVATIDASPSIATSTAPIANAGATTRSTVSVTGRGASVASRPAAHDTQSSVAQATRGPSDHVASDAETAGPAVRGRMIHAARSNHRAIERGSFDSVCSEHVRAHDALARLEHVAEPIVEYDPMAATFRAPVLLPGVATGIGSLPHDDPVEAAELVLRCLPELPAVPQLPGRDPRESMLAQWLCALPEIDVAL